MTTHVVIIGAYGSAGVAVAGKLVNHSAIELTLIDDGDPGGGLCILRGCMPSKEVLSAGAHRYHTRHDNRLIGTPPEIDLSDVIATKDEHIHNFAAHRRAAVNRIAERSNVEFIQGTARFVADHTIAVAGRTIEADYVVIATGSRPNIPSLPGIDEVEYMTSADVLEATTFPDSGIVMGFGYIGLELVPYLAEAGDMELTVIEHNNRPLDEADPEYGDELMEIYRRDFNITILPNTSERSVASTADGGVQVTVDQNGTTEQLVADSLFVFTGRQPNITEIGLEHTSVSSDEDWVTDSLQARDDSHVFVVGDANEKEPILHVAKEQGFTAAANILAHRNDDPVTEYTPLHHHVIFSGLGIYPYVRIGHSDASATAAGVDAITVTRQASDDGVFTTKTVPDGLASLVVDSNDGTVLGYQGLHYDADVMAKTMQIVIELSLDVRELPDRAYHPTTPEILDGLFRDARTALAATD